MISRRFIMTMNMRCTDRQQYFSISSWDSRSNAAASVVIAPVVDPQSNQWIEPLNTNRSQTSLAQIQGNDENHWASQLRQAASHLFPANSTKSIENQPSTIIRAQTDDDFIQRPWSLSSVSSGSPCDVIASPQGDREVTEVEISSQVFQFDVKKTLDSARLSFATRILADPDGPPPFTPPPPPDFPPPPPPSSSSSSSYSPPPPPPPFSPPPIQDQFFYTDLPCFFTSPEVAIW